MKAVIAVMGGLAVLSMGGCLFSMDENLHAPPLEDVSAWADSADARRGMILLGSDISPAAAITLARKIVALDQDPEVERLLVVINSNGGDTSALRSIYNAMRFTRKPVDTVNVGNCYSAACAIFAGATGKRYAFAKAHFMVHRPRAVGGADRRYREVLDFEIAFFESVLRDSGLPQKWFPLGSQDHYFTAQEAQEFGFLDEIVTELP